MGRMPTCRELAMLFPLAAFTLAACCPNPATESLPAQLDAGVPGRPEIIIISAADLTSAWKKHLWQNVEVDGIVDGVRASGRPVVWLEGAYGWTVNCDFTAAGESAVKSAASLKKGQRVKVRGQVTECIEKAQAVLVDHCTTVDVIPGK